MKKMLICLSMLSLYAEEATVEPPKVMTHEWEEKLLGVKHGVVDLPTAIEELTLGISPSSALFNLNH
jgi:hypothetical protein